MFQWMTYCKGKSIFSVSQWALSPRWHVLAWKCLEDERPQLVSLNEALFNRAPSEGDETSPREPSLDLWRRRCADSHPKLCANGQGEQQEVSVGVMIHAMLDCSMINICAPSHWRLGHMIAFPVFIYYFHSRKQNSVNGDSNKQFRKGEAGIMHGLV